VINWILFFLHRYYAWDYRVLKTFARHYSTGEVIPQKLFESMLGAKNMFAATDLQRQVFFLLFFLCLFGMGGTGWQHHPIVFYLGKKVTLCNYAFCQIFYALVDQTLFGEQPLPLGDSSSVVAELKRKHTNLEHIEGTHWEARFSHLLSYGAGGYEII
jgi:intermediate peptidase